MCCDCWEEYGSPMVVNERVLKLQGLIDMVGFGSNLHIVLDDNNTDDDCLDFCREAIEKNEFNDSEEQLLSESECLKLLYAMTVEERDSAIALHDGCWKISESGG
mgnify:CR=1 FL=1